jgi:hypothetical protein
MCVLFWAEKGTFTIPYVTEFCCYNRQARRLLVSVTGGLTNSETEDVVVGALCRGRVGVSASVWRWNAYAAGGDDRILDMFSSLYGCHLVADERGQTSVLLDEQEVSRGGSFLLPPRDLSIGVLRPVQQPPERGQDFVALDDQDAPFTAFAYGPLEGRKNWLYNFDVVIEGQAYDRLIGQAGLCTVDGAAVLRRRLLYEDLRGSPEIRSWRRFFEDTVLTNAMKPSRYDVLITNDAGELPKCYRLCARTRRVFIPDPELDRKVAWFTSDDPDQDFVIEVDFEKSA